MIRLIPENENGFSRDINSYKYLELNHLNAFRDPTLLQVGAVQSWHWSLYHVDGSHNNYLYQDVLCFDFDLKLKFKKNNTKLPVDDSHLTPILKGLSDTLKIDQKCFGVVTTGYGYHVYLFFNERFDVSEEKFLKHLSSLVHSNVSTGLLEFDRQSLAHKKTMRLPTSYYQKSGRVKAQTRILKQPLAFASFDKMRNNFKSLNVDKPTKGLEDKNLVNIHQWYKPDIQAVIGSTDNPWGGCRFIQWSYRSQNEVTHSEWILQLSILAKLMKDETQAYNYAREFSIKYKGFNEDEFREKFNYARNEINTATCETISSTWSGANVTRIGCVDCPHRRKNLPIKICNYPNQDTGFRKPNIDKKSGKITGYGKINYESFVKFLRETQGLIAEKDSTLYEYAKKYYAPLTDAEFNSYYSEQFILNGVEPSEIEPILKKFRFNQVFDLDKVERKYKDYFIFNNGTLHAPTQRLIDHDKGIIKFTKLNFDYDEDAKAPLFESVLDFAFGDNIKIRNYFLQFIAASLYGVDHLEKILVLFGEGRNGKSTLMNAVQSLFAKSDGTFVSFSPTALERDNSYAQRLRKSKIAYISDMDSNLFNRNMDVFKRIASKELMTYRIPYARSTIEFRPQANLVIGLNMLPSISEDSRGARRRFTIMPFDRAVPAELVDITLGEKLKEEKSGIFNIIHEAYLEFKRVGALTDFKENEEILHQTLTTSSVINDWYHTNVVFTGDKKDFVTVKKLYEDFFNFALISKVDKPPTLQKFSKFLYSKQDVRDNKTRRSGGGTRGVEGFKLDSDQDDYNPQQLTVSSQYE